MGKKDNDLKLPKPIADIYDAGFSNSFIKNDYIDNTSVVQTGMVTADVNEFLNTLEVEEEFLGVEVTTTASFTWYTGTTTQRYKDTRKSKPPIGIAFLRTDITNDERSYKWKSLPYYKFKTTVEPITNSFFAQQVHKIRFYRTYFELLVDSNTLETFTYDVFILRDKYGNK